MVLLVWMAVELAVLDEYEQVPLRYQTYYLPSVVGYREPMMSCFECLVYLLDRLDCPERHHLLTHYFLSPDIFVNLRNFILQDRHLLSSHSSVVKSSCEKSSDKV